MDTVTADLLTDLVSNTRPWVQPVAVTLSSNPLVLPAGNFEQNGMVEFTFDQQPAVVRFIGVGKMEPWNVQCWGIVPFAVGCNEQRLPIWRQEGQKR